MPKVNGNRPGSGIGVLHFKKSRKNENSNYLIMNLDGNLKLKQAEGGKGKTIIGVTVLCSLFQ